MYNMTTIHTPLCFTHMCKLGVNLEFSSQGKKTSIFSFSFFLFFVSIQDDDVNQIYFGNHFTLYVGQTIMLYVHLKFIQSYRSIKSQ